MALPVNIDSTYADSGSDASVALHQQHHDTIHGAVNHLAGGAQGQVPVKQSSTDYDFGLITPPWGGGDYYRSGYYSYGIPLVGSFGSVSLTLNQVYVRPFLVSVRRAFDRIALNVSVAATGGSGGVIRLGIYSPGTGVPGALLVDAGTASSESTGVKEMTISVTLDPGVYWLAAVAQVATCTVTCLPSNSGSPYSSHGTSAPSSGGVVTGWSMGSVTGAFGSFTPAGATVSMPVTSLRAV
jgi:hypothetical protein